MKLIAGLGNIGEKYTWTRHNVGFMVVDKYAIMNNITFKENKKLQCYITKFKRGLEDIILIKPTTFMNLSGNSVVKAAHFYKILPQNIVVIHDDMDLPTDKIKYNT